MAAKNTYVRVTEDDFDGFMASVAEHEVVDEPGVNEKVYELPLPHEDLSIRVYSTVVAGAGRDRGADAIRCVVWSDEVGGPVGGRRKTLRIETWRKNLHEKINDLYASWREHHHGHCPGCGSGVLVEREPGQGDEWDAFLACSNWGGGDGCEYTEPL